MTPADTEAGYAKMSFKPYMNSSEGPGNVTIAPNASMIGNASANASAANASATNNTAAWKSKTPVNYRTASKEEIANTSALERMWRNANLKNIVPQSYNGTVDRPTWINPSPDVIMMTDQPKVIRDSLDMTRPGVDAHTLFWDL